MRIGIDLGGTKIEGIVIEQRAVLSRRRVPTPAGNYAATIEAVAALVAALEEDVGVSPLPIGIGHPGSIAPRSGLLRNANSTCLNGQPFGRDIEARLARPVRLANDANCMALSELHDGAAQGVDSAFLVILGTGVGGAVVQEGRLQTGHNGLAGEWGHNPLPWPGPREYPGEACWCGQTGCLETWLSGPGFSRRHAAQTGQSLTPAQIAGQAEAGDAQALSSVQAYCDRLARALAAVINLLDPQLIVLAGGVSQLRALYDEVPRRWQRWVFADTVDTRLTAARHGDASGVFGAARLE